jgi:hypothetical protein
LLSRAIFLVPVADNCAAKARSERQKPFADSVHLENPLSPHFALARQKFGMLGVTGFGLLFTPVFYSFIRKWGRSNTIGFQQQRANQLMYDASINIRRVELPSCRTS